MSSSDSTPTKELLSQNEIEALLEIFTTHEPVKEGEVLLEVGMTKVALGLQHYLESIGIYCDEVSVVPGEVDYAHEDAYVGSYQPLSALYIEPPLALDIIGARLGQKERCYEASRTLSALEQRLLVPVYDEIVYNVEKELDDYFSKNSVQESLFYILKVVYDGVESVVVLDFSLRQEVATVTTLLPNKTQMVVSVGTLQTLNLEENHSYTLDDFGANRALLLLDNSAGFLVERIEEADTLSLELLGPLSDHRLFERYHLVIACGHMSDETLMALRYGAVLKVAPFVEAKIYKEGKAVADASVYRSDQRVMIKVENGRV